jgi:N-acetylneuraminate synthase
MATDRTFIIAEAGVNHNGSVDIAKSLIDAAVDCGADAVKFQTFRADSLATAAAEKADYQNRTTDASESQREMLRRLELSESDFVELAEHARQKSIELMSTAFDPESLLFLTERLGLRRLKVPSGEITNAPFLLQTARAADQLILSTGMSTMSDIEQALGVFAFAWTHQGEPASRLQFEQAFASAEGQTALSSRTTILHCTTEYPAPMHEINLRAMETIGRTFNLPVGYSDHSDGVEISVAAVALGARIIEKHLTLDRSMEGPDHAASLEPQKFAEMCLAIRRVEIALGDGVKRPTASEWKNREIARKSIVAAVNTAAGQPMDLATKRPGTGLSPFEYWRLRSSPATRDYRKDELLDG